VAGDGHDAGGLVLGDGLVVVRYRNIRAGGLGVVVVFLKKLTNYKAGQHANRKHPTYYDCPAFYSDQFVHLPPYI
jgi:hypothetical protein